MPHNPGVLEVVVFGHLFLGEVVEHLGDDRFEVALLGTSGRRIAGGHVVITRDVDYISTSPVPFAPLTSKGLHFLAVNATSGLAEAEAGVIYYRRYGRWM